MKRWRPGREVQTAGNLEEAPQEEDGRQQAAANEDCCCGLLDEPAAQCSACKNFGGENFDMAKRSSPGRAEHEQANAAFRTTNG